MLGRGRYGSRFPPELVATSGLCYRSWERETEARDRKLQSILSFQANYRGARFICKYKTMNIWLVHVIIIMICPGVRCRQMSHLTTAQNCKALRQKPSYTSCTTLFNKCKKQHVSTQHPPNQFLQSQRQPHLKVTRALTEQTKKHRRASPGGNPGPPLRVKGSSSFNFMCVPLKD